MMLRSLLNVAGFEYSRIVFRKRFLLVLLSPVLILLAMGIVMVLMIFSLFSSKPMGIVDLTGNMQPPASMQENRRINTQTELLVYADEESGREALDAEEVGALYIVDETYFSTGKVHLVAEKYPEEEAQSDVKAFLRKNLADAYSPGVSDRLLIGSIVQTVRPVSEGEEPSGLQRVEGTFLLKMFVPMIFSILFMVIIGVTSGYMLNAVIDEKTNRTVEILLTSVTPLQLMAGKIIGNLAIGLTQLLVWGGLPLLAVGIGGAFLPNFVDLGLDTGLVWIAAALVMLGVVQFSALLTIMGSMVVEDREAQQMSGLVSLIFVIPFFFMSKLMFEPTGKIAVMMSLIPFWAPLSMPFRIAFSEVPALHIVLSFAFSLLNTALVLWLAGVAFRRGIMQFDRRLRLKELFRKEGGRNE
jgi:ABC-2 type transport system permease protein